ncbi:BRO-N domain-containing protein [Streptomyces mobaraensis]|uniref:Bro-N domain-containing protein n=1 Tax=Streptomyces mobaraensis TaxID=35621 RepID=A0A5N5WEH4_STRMB|nr:Bro-N domain-containing protein [Streptomyces mobaraensis]KAB7850179.1 Bro-N domain-containing protein [Streptomyces mobaraensis]
MIEHFTNAEFDLQVLPRPGTFIVLAPGLARGLSYKDARDMLRSVPEDEQGSALVRTPGGGQRVRHVTEPGFYRIIGQRKTGRVKDPVVREQIERFQRWIFHDVLPSIRTHGHYEPPAPSRLGEPVVLTWEAAAAHLQQRYGLPVTGAIDLRQRLKDAGVLKLTGTPRADFRLLFWPVGSRFDIHAHALPILASRITEALYRLAEAQAGVQTALELDAIGRAALGGGR